MILAKTVCAILEYMLVGRSCFCPRLGDRVPSKQGSLFLDSSLLGQPLVLGLETESPPLKQESLSWIPHSSAKLQSLLGDRVPSKQGSLFLDSSLHPPWLGDRVPFSQSRSLRSLSFLAAGMTETDLRCIKCNEDVTLETSHASGRNALRRVCLECSATDRWLQRCRKTKDKKGGESEKEKEARLSAEKVTMSLSKMSSEEKVAWYKKQKEERAENNGHRKRTFETAVGALTEAKKRLESQQDIDRWYRFKDWAAREVLLTGAKPEDLPRLWKSETSKPGAITKVVRGELLLKEWTGCEDRLGSQHEMSASVKQRMDLLAKEDLERFQEISAGRLERGENLLSADRLVNSANNTRQESQLLNVVADMEEAAENRRAQEARLFEEAEIAEARRKALQEEKPKVSSATLEKLQYEQSLEKAETTIESWLRKHRNAYTGMVADIKEAGIESDEGGKVELQIKAQDFERLVNELKRDVMEKIETLGSLQIFLCCNREPRELTSEGCPGFNSKAILHGSHRKTQ